MTNEFELLDELAALGETEVGIDHIEVDQLRPVAAGRGLHGEVQRQLTLAAAVVADHDIYLFQNDAPPLEGYLKCANGY